MTPSLLILRAIHPRERERLGIFYVPCSGEAGVATFKNTHTHSAVSIPEEQS